MLILATFGDGDEPQVTEALNVAHVPYKICLQVNNVAWFWFNKKKKSPNEIYWDISFESLKTFFLEVGKAESTCHYPCDDDKADCAAMSLVTAWFVLENATGKNTKTIATDLNFTPL